MKNFSFNLKTSRTMKAALGRGMTGIDDPYEAPESPDLVLTPADGSPEAQAELVLELISRPG